MITTGTGLVVLAIALLVVGYWFVDHMDDRLRWEKETWGRDDDEAE